MEMTNDLEILENRIRSAMASLLIDEDTEALEELVKALKIIDIYL